MMFMHQFLDRLDESRAEARIRRLISPEEDRSSRVEFLGHFLRSHYQPVFERRGGRLETVGFEAFVRPVAGKTDVAPHSFFASMDGEDRLLVDGVTREMHIAGFLKAARSEDFLSLNAFSFALEAEGSWFEQLRQQIIAARGAGLLPERLNIEIAASAQLDAGIIYTFASALKALGVQLTLEDFDADGASFSRVVFIRPDFVKFNRSWLNGDLASPSHRDMVRRVVEALSALGASAHLEKIETEMELEFALACGFTRFQGFYLAHPQEALAHPTAPDAVSA